MDVYKWMEERLSQRRKALDFTGCDTWECGFMTGVEEVLALLKYEHKLEGEENGKN